MIFPTGVVRDLTALLDGRLVVTTFSALGGLGVIGADGSMTPLPVELFPGQLIRRPDGATFALGGGEPGTRVASLIRPDGALDTGFEADVAAVLPPGARMGATNVVYSPPNGTLLSDGRLAVAFAYTTAAPSQAVCGLVALQEDGRYDPAFGSGGLVSIPQAVCRVDHFADDSVRVTGDFGQPVIAFSSTGAPLGELAAPFDHTDLAFEGTGRLFAKTGPNQITAFDPLGNADPTFGANGVATLPGMAITGFALLDSGDIVAWGNPVGNATALALGLIDGEHGTALQPPAIPTTKFVPVTPTRILDTREGVGAPAGAVGAGGQIDLQIAGVAGIAAAGVSAVVLNVTATEATQAGYVSVYPAGTRRPAVSNVNLESPGQTASNLVTVKVGSTGQVSLFTSGGAHLVADVTGYYAPAVTSTDGRLQTATPQRILDTREGLGAPTATLPAGGQVELQVTGRGPVPADGVAAVVLNVTGDRATADGHVTVWPTGLERPVVSNLNLVAGETRANLVVVPIGAGGSVSLFTSGGADLIADVAGWFTDATAPSASAGLFVPITPTRVSRHAPRADRARCSAQLACPCDRVDGHGAARRGAGRRCQHHGHRVRWAGIPHCLAGRHFSPAGVQPQHGPSRANDRECCSRPARCRRHRSLHTIRRAAHRRPQRLVHRRLSPRERGLGYALREL